MLLAVCLLALGFTWTGMAAKFVLPACDRQVFDTNVDVCLSVFNISMEDSGYQERCPWPTVKNLYDNLKFCVDHWDKVTGCRGQGFLADRVFSTVHHAYFSQCGLVQDPPLATLVLMTAPAVIATLSMPFLCAQIHK